MPAVKKFEDKCVDERRWKAVVLDEDPDGNAIWAVTYHPADGRVYVAATCEHLDGHSFKLVAYDPATGKKGLVFDTDKVTHESALNGRVTHNKVHYSMISSRDGKLYMAPHCTGAPYGDARWLAEHTWNYYWKSYSGSPLIVYDPATDTVENRGILCEGEGTRSLALDEDRRKLYGITYPRSHFYVYYLETGQYKDLGRTSCYNSQVVFLDDRGFAYHADDYGYLIRCHPERDELEKLDVQLPYPPKRDGQWNIWYDAVSPDGGKTIYGSTWAMYGHLFKYIPGDGPQGRIEGLGRGYDEDSLEWTQFDRANHCGALVIGHDGLLYYTMANDRIEPFGKHLIRMNLDTYEKEDLGLVKVDDLISIYHCRAVKDKDGVLYFAEVGNIPPRLLIYRPEYLGM